MSILIGHSCLILLGMASYQNVLVGLYLRYSDFLQSMDFNFVHLVHYLQVFQNFRFF